MTAPLTPEAMTAALDKIRTWLELYARRVVGTDAPETARCIAALDQLRAEHAEMSKRCIACGSLEGHYSDCMNNIEGYLAEDPI